jgi:GH24 family phage-related lysozyme (muramidase)
MKNNKMFWVIGAAVLLALMLIPGNVFGASLMTDTANFIIGFEGFVDHPYLDAGVYSWGYGTRAPGATGTIDRETAMTALLEHVQIDYDYLRPLVIRTLTQNQWTALLDFSYNEGSGNADNLIDDINNGNDDILETHWKKYIYASGSINDDLVNRRNAEWQLWQS